MKCYYEDNYPHPARDGQIVQEPPVALTRPLCSLLETHLLQARGAVQGEYGDATYRRSGSAHPQQLAEGDADNEREAKAPTNRPRSGLLTAGVSYFGGSSARDCMVRPMRRATTPAR